MEDNLELYKKYRPTNFKDLVGQTEAKSVLSSWGRSGELPHSILLTGPSGTGKTTIARIVADKLDCKGSDFQELNAADFRGIDSVRSIRSEIMASPLFGKCRVWLLDECQSLTSDAQDALLKLTEDTPRHAYFMLASTDPQKLKKTVLTRFSEVKCTLLSEADLTMLIKRVLAAENVTLGDNVIANIVDAAEGSARAALVTLHKVYRLPDQNAQLAAIAKGDPKKQGKDLVTLFMRGGAWSEVQNWLRGIDDEPERVRRAIMGYTSAVMRNSNKDCRKLAQIMDCFRFPFYDNGAADLTLACYNLFNGGRE